MKKPTMILSDEHKNILKVIDSVLKKCDEIERGRKLTKIFFIKAIDFIKNYADKFHHAKKKIFCF